MLKIHEQLKKYEIDANNRNLKRMMLKGKRESEFFFSEKEVDIHDNSNLLEEDELKDEVRSLRNQDNMR